MKNSTIVYCLLLCFFLSACSDLKEDTSQVKTFDEHFQTDEEVRNFILPVYTTLSADYYFQEMAMMDGVISDEIVRPAQGYIYSDGYWLNLQRHQLNPLVYEQQNFNTWSYWYYAIEQINRLLQTLQASSFPSVVEPYVAELKVFRAFFYLQLIDKYGNVPIMEEGDLLNQTCTSPRPEVFAFIEKSLLENMHLLSKNKGGDYLGRMNFFVAQAMLAKLYLNAEVYRGAPAWNEAIAACDAIIGSGKFSLSGNYFDNFKIDSKSSHENILVASCFYSHCNWFPPYVFSLHGSHLGDLVGGDAGYWGNTLVVQPDFYGRYDSQDARIQCFFVGQQFDEAGNPILDSQADSTDPDGLAINYTPEINLDFPLRQAGIRFAKFEIDTTCINSVFDCAA
ncbi:MAG: RagB/SusD family nutrient uptake outer membrane protein, partial [Bacteroidota bacterium]